MLYEELAVDPLELGVGARNAAARLEHVHHGHWGRDRVVSSRTILLCRFNDPVREVASVDQLNRRVGRARC